jgi:hypothetical protein
MRVKLCHSKYQRLPILTHALELDFARAALFTIAPRTAKDVGHVISG